eukprot:TRINITY_DN8432_c0_g1_i3.p1 TRINITY_DN8432_c0_g1~~TRINITY_DN8432_c0_g1_i3.p1  ORF type:complete len:234 (+),score=-3.22 TRINITY_DN8432_c0_g1_i3:107-808(+)
MYLPFIPRRNIRFLKKLKVVGCIIAWLIPLSYMVATLAYWDSSPNCCQQIAIVVNLLFIFICTCFCATPCFPCFLIFFAMTYYKHFTNENEECMLSTATGYTWVTLFLFHSIFIIFILATLFGLVFGIFFGVLALLNHRWYYRIVEFATIPDPLIMSLEPKKYEAEREGLKDESHQSCAICLESYKNEDEVCELESCKHMFHRGCLVNWIRLSSTCPYCRQTLHQQPLDAYLL